MSDQSRLPDQTVERVLETLPGAEVSVQVDRHRLALTRFANSVIHQNVAEDATTMRVVVHLDGRTASGSASVVADDDVRTLVDRIADVGPGGPARPDVAGARPARAAPARPRASTWRPRARPRRTAPRWSAGSSTAPRGSRPRGTAGPTTGPAVSRARRGSRSPARPWSAGSPGSPGSTAPTAWPVTHRSASPSSTVSPSVGERPPRHAARREPWSCRRVATRSCWSPTPSST